MTKLALNKSVLNKKKKQLQTYEKFLPALELKQLQLLAERKKVQCKISELEQQHRELMNYVSKHLPMLGCPDIHLSGMVKVKEVNFEEKHVVGIAIPSVKEVILDVVTYGFLSKPHWVDPCIRSLQAAVTIEIHLQVENEALRRLSRAIRIATQRVNLFSKILIPETKNTIQKIHVFVSDMETAAVVRSKITKQKSGQRNG